MTPKYEAGQPGGRSQSRHTNFKISDKLAEIERSRSGSGREDSYKQDEVGYRRDRAKKIYVKVINTLEPSHESASAFTRKTKLPGHKVRSAYQSVISFSNQLNAEHSQENNLAQAVEFRDEGDSAEPGTPPYFLRH